MPPALHVLGQGVVRVIVMVMVRVIVMVRVVVMVMLMVMVMVMVMAMVVEMTFVAAQSLSLVRQRLLTWSSASWVAGSLQEHSWHRAT